MKIYLDSSAATKLVVEEPESAALLAYLEERAASAEFVSSILFETELRRAARRRGIDEENVTAAVDLVNLAEAPRAVFKVAAAIGPMALRSLDAIHLATALREDVDVLVTFDRRLQDAGREAGLVVEAPA
ncbi:type II toxin-antitoxin system VapC family toxin [Nocardioides sp. LMS-CY]|uniref:type II toxin-antitoxin system VapC family toxin n=1 Tax=Nocardioides sp. (strain LMS-CY) TaxID=2840457 RepID=UPI001BFFDFCC|nr:type II toxin-antitoxin system VapC family toxin [Nocardioides sp. LMS-CY]QWF24000.1 type II toxin-antitoxin system VapC family toxin [Nocardioides sp. LMS-CY]